MGRHVSEQNREALKMLASGMRPCEVARVQKRSKGSVWEFAKRARSAGMVADEGCLSLSPVDLELGGRCEVTVMGDIAYVKEPGARVLKMRTVDVIPCVRCGLRGHVAGDPDRCLHGDGFAGLGGMQNEQPMRRRSA